MNGRQQEISCVVTIYRRAWKCAKPVQFQMAVLQSNRERKLKLQDLNSFITCEICRGYLIKPTTITECLHTFCRSCIVKYLQDSDDNNCPSCSSQIHETNPFDLLRSDKTLEDIIHKLVPKLQEREQRREREFLEQLNSENEKKTKEAEETKEYASDSATEPANKRKKLSATEENYHRDDPQIGVCLECLIDDSVQAEHPVRELERKYIRCSSRLTIAQVKKFLKVKLNLKTADQVEVMCNGEIMGKDHTLEFVYMTRWRVKEGSVLVLQYRPRLDFL
ncbi:polycomb group RING finger protein 5-B-like isoform X2 [Orbicella faveolata]|uniref:polycomb group RING finger protein 5-B-like isoform X2 n=1 Tax=Orbicella faveolata TaxID=48498 RepID=UPI0009E61687|nr:polycomb group RING finger protein 5-B-like isoform X2 [Orbicella faveolata]